MMICKIENLGGIEVMTFRPRLMLVSENRSPNKHWGKFKRAAFKKLSLCLTKRSA